MIKENDCKTVNYKLVEKGDKKGNFEDSFEDKIYSHCLASDVKDAKGKTIVEAGSIIDTKVLKIIEEHAISSVKIRSVLTCETENGVCQRCYGLDLGLNKEADIGTPVGIIAAQSIGEPGTQLTMRTFHSG